MGGCVRCGKREGVSLAESVVGEGNSAYHGGFGGMSGKNIMVTAFGFGNT